MNTRDYDYIWNRLEAGTNATEAVTRLRDVGQADLAERLMEAVQRFTDDCRVIRYELRDKVNAGQA